jgi:hypothetical protein
MGIIQQNPEKSKHLETATAQLGRFSVDFVNLRTEVNIFFLVYISITL